MRMTTDRTAPVWLGGESVSLASTHSLVLDVPVLLLTFDGAVARVPTTVVHRLLLTVIALTHRTHFNVVKTLQL